MLLTGNTITFPWRPKGGETLSVTMRRPTTTELDRYYRSRHKAVQDKESKEIVVVDSATPARIALVDALLVDLRGLEMDTSVGLRTPGRDCFLSEEDKAALTKEFGRPVESWRDLIPVEWRVEWTSRFEGPVGQEVADPLER